METYPTYCLPLCVCVCVCACVCVRQVVNPSEQDALVEVEQMGLGDWPSAATNTIKLVHGEGEHQYTVVTGAVDVPKTNKVVAVAIVTLRVPSSLQVSVCVLCVFYVRERTGQGQ
ncbi:hypothetical protein E2C01_065058 [Portunus trituberculatus]|uniref:Uncharacterized protein n=1 Tax=Portunus trituberculatus TaxID=210409 RepID=A0A5B7HLZ3_PORTR|nr:hypothetical protein [Portunus trituberculatus]